MNRQFILVLLLVAVSCKNGESIFSKNKGDRPSPPRMAQGTVGDVNLLVDYSSPRVKGRKIWGELVPFNKIWRTGANEATVITLSSDVLIEGQLLPKGKYSFFTVPGEQQWKIIFNKEWDLWGSYDYDEKKDVLTFFVTPKKLDAHVENMTFTVKQDGVSFEWEKLGFDFKVLPK